MVRPSARYRNPGKAEHCAASHSQDSHSVAARAPNSMPQTGLDVGTVRSRHGKGSMIPNGPPVIVTTRCHSASRLRACATSRQPSHPLCFRCLHRHPHRLAAVQGRSSASSENPQASMAVLRTKTTYTKCILCIFADLMRKSQLYGSRSHSYPHKTPHECKSPFIYTWIVRCLSLAVTHSSMFELACPMEECTHGATWV